MMYIDRLIEQNKNKIEFRVEGNLNKIPVKEKVSNYVLQKLYEQGKNSVKIRTDANRKLGIYQLDIE